MHKGIFFLTRNECSPDIVRVVRIFVQRRARTRPSFRPLFSYQTMSAFLRQAWNAPFFARVSAFSNAISSTWN